MDSHPGKEGGEQRRRRKKMTTFEFENRGLRVTTSSILGDVWWLILDTECGVWRSLLETQKKLSSYLETHLKAFPSCPQKQEASCGFRQHSHRRASGEGPQLPLPGRPRGLLVYRDGCYIHSSVYAWSPVTREATRCNASVSSTEI